MNTSKIVILIVKKLNQINKPRLISPRHVNSNGNKESEGIEALKRHLPSSDTYFHP